MGILGMISNAKASFRSVQRSIEGGNREQAIMEAEKLGITTQQIKDRKIEEKARYKEVYDKERMKTIEAQAKAKAKEGPALMRFAKGLNKSIQESKSRGQARQDIFGGGKGPDFGQGNFSFGQTKKEVKPKKGKQIIINL